MLRLLLAALAFFLAPLATPVAAIAQVSGEAEERLEKRAADIVSILRGDAVYSEVFSASFVSSVPETQMQAIAAQISGQFGDLVGLESVQPTGESMAKIRIRFERGMGSGVFQIAPSPPYAVTGFVLNEMQPLDDNPADIVASLEALPGSTSLLVTPLEPGAQPLLAHRADRQMAIGSTFKLYVLSALATAIAEGRHGWDEVVRLDQRSYPGGDMRNWPQGAPVTLHTLATLMISVSDNTATDQLIAVLGREAVEAEVVASGHAQPDLMAPFLTTRELFLLKSGDDPNLGEFASMGTAERLATLQALASVERGDVAVQSAFTGGPNAIDIEWFASAQDIASIFRRIARMGDTTALDILAVDPAMGDASRDQWTYAGYKGGSEPGVLNLSWLLRDDAGEWHVVSLSWNNAEADLDNAQLELLAMRAIALAASR